MSKELVDICEKKCLEGQVLSREEIIALLNIPVGSPEDAHMRRAARNVARAIAGNRGYIWCAVGMDYAPCPMNCRFCSFGEKWGIVREGRHVTEDAIIEHARRYVEGGAAYIVLRTTEFYSLDVLTRQIPRIREQVPGDYGIILNTGELDADSAERVRAAGAYGVYHALRLREGIDTPFAVSERVATMKSVSGAGMALISLVEPLGPEHDAGEIADRFLNAVACGASISGVMARFPVKGTPLGDTEMLDDETISHVVAALRLSGGNRVRDICVHPASPAALMSGANVVVVETGAVPRDSRFAEDDWVGAGMQQASALLAGEGYRLSMPPELRSQRKKCACMGGNLEKFMQPIMLKLLSRGPGTGYALQKEMEHYATYERARPDMAATYRFLKSMEQRGLVSSHDGMYHITSEGQRCLAEWKNTLRNYSATLLRLIEQLEE